MRRWHFYVMGLIALIYGVLGMIEYVLISYGLQMGWLDYYPAEQLEWLGSIPGWIHGIWGAHATLALVGALCLLAHLRASVWMLFFSFATLVVLIGWAVGFAQPSLAQIVGGGTTVWAAIIAVLVLNATFYIYARQEKQVGEVL